jgi:hypothetical protein
VYRPVHRQWKETWYGEKPDVHIPHEVVADLLVLSVEDHTAMALVRRSNTELWYGDHFRTVGGPHVDWQEEGPMTWSERVKRTAAQMPTPSMPDAVSDWNLPRLGLPELDGYDPR